MKIGFIGLGIMGSRMAANLLTNGYELIVYNRTAAKAKPLLQKGAVFASSPDELATKVDVLFTMLSTPDVVRETALGEYGFLDNMKGNSLWADCSTVNPSFSKGMASEAHKRGIHFIDCPVAGSKIPAETGELIFLTGGDKKDVELCRPMFDVMGKNTIYAGEVGMGTSMKLVFNLLLGETMMAFAEALTLGQSLGIDKNQLLDVLLQSHIAAPFLKGKKEMIAKDKYDPEFPLRLMQKDAQLVSLTAYEQGIALPAVNVIKEVYALASRDGMGDLDFSAICSFLLNKPK